MNLTEARKTNIKSLKLFNNLTFHLKKIISTASVLLVIIKHDINAKYKYLTFKLTIKNNCFTI